MRVVVLACLLTLGGCLHDAEPIDIVPAPGASDIAVAVRVVDRRAGDHDRVGVRKNARGMAAAAIVTTRDVTEIVHDALTAALMRRGFRADGAGRVVEVDLLTFYNDFRFSFAAGASVATVAFTARVVDAAGRIRFERTITGRHRLETVGFATVGDAKRALEQALADAIARLFEPPDFLAVLQTG